MPHIIRKYTTKCWKHNLSTGRMCELKYSDEDNGFVLTINGEDSENRIFQAEDLYVIKDIIVEAILDSAE